MKYLPYFFVFLVLLVSVNAFDANILTYRSDYTSFETFQAEIIFDDNIVGDLTTFNFDLYGEESIATLKFVEKLNDRHYFVYLDIPYVENGVYYFKLKNVKYLEGEVLKNFNKEKSFNINNINSGFDYLIENQNEDGSFNTISETSLASLALKNVYSNEANDAIDYLVENQDVSGCYPSGNCNVIDTSLALITLKEFNKNYIKTLNWLKDAGNNFNVGTWEIEINGNGICSYDEEDYTVVGQLTLDVNGVNVSLSCDSEMSFVLKHNYFGSNYDIYDSSGNNFDYLIESSGCYGINYRNDCDYISTLYASWALKKVDEIYPEDYLIENRLDNRTIDHALGHLIYSDEYSKDWLLNNQINDYWSYNSASISQTPDYYISALATHALKDEIIFEDSKDYLKDKTEESILDGSMILYLLFDDQVLLDSVSISPGIVNEENSFELILTTYRDPVNVVIEAPNFTELPSNIQLIDSSVFEINVPLDEESFEIIIEYSNKSYTIPIILEPIQEGVVLLPPPKDALKFTFESDVINLTVNKNDILVDDLEFVNNWDFSILNASIILTGNLNEIVKIEQDTIELIEGGEIKNIGITINSNKNVEFNLYQGFIILKSEDTFDSIPMTLNFFEGEVTGDTEIGESEETEEETEEDDEKTTSPKSDEKKSGSLWWLWLIIILIVGVIIFLFLRKKKVVTEDFGEHFEK